MQDVQAKPYGLLEGKGTMKFSVIIPAHNSAAFIRRALDSIAGQTYKDYELIVVCDSCEDDTEAIARSYGARTAVVNNHCDGPTRQTGLDMATGDWVLWMDDDDWWVRPDVLELLACRLRDEDILAFSFEWPDGRVATPRGNRGFYWPALWTKCWRRDFVSGVKFHNVQRISDWEWWCDVAKLNPRISEWNIVFYHYNYLRKGSQTDRRLNG